MGAGSSFLLTFSLTVLMLLTMRKIINAIIRKLSTALIKVPKLSVAAPASAAAAAVAYF